MSKGNKLYVNVHEIDFCLKNTMLQGAKLRIQIYVNVYENGNKLFTKGTLQT